MRKILMILLVLLPLLSKATNFYFSTSGSDAANGLSPATAWKTLSKFQSVINNNTIHAFDSVLFKRGDVFVGSITINGSAPDNVILSAYGTGNKPEFNYPTGGTATPEQRTLMLFNGVDGWVMDNFNFSDQIKSTDHVAGANCGFPIYLGSDDNNDNNRIYCNNWEIKNTDISFCGMGIVLIANNCNVHDCTMSNFKNLRSTTASVDQFGDYGANPFTIIGGSGNHIHNNDIRDGWAESLDFGYNGGFCEMFRSCNGNIIEKNTIVDCNGLSEFGSSSAGHCSNNIFAANKIINCGMLLYYNISGLFSVQCDSSYMFNNTITEQNGISRYSGTNGGAGIVSAEALGHFSVDTRMFGYNTSPSATLAFILKNNIFQINTGIDMRDHGGEKTTHENNVYKLSNGSILNYTAGASEISSSATLFVNTTATDAKNWDFNLITGSPAIGSGQNIASYTTDILGNPLNLNIGAYGPIVGTTPVLPTITTTAITAITTTTATSGGNITSDGGDFVTARGVCWSTSVNPTTSSTKTTNGTGTGSFASSITGLTSATLYHVRAFATNSVGTAYGADVTFTSATIVLPTVTTTAISAITTTTASSGGNVTADGGAAVSARGVCWAITVNPTTASSKTTDGTGTGVFTSSLTSLTPGTLYHVRAYATNTAGTSYGSDLTFTATAVTVATVTTTAISAITLTTASSGGNVTSDGNSAVTVRGVCWSTSVNPTTGSSTTFNGTGTGVFTSSLTGLAPGTLYHVRAYATNGIGTAYGSDVTFTTTALVLPTVITTSITSITSTDANSGGNVTADGGATVTVRGVCWAVTSNPTTSNSTTSNGTGTGSFISTLTSLTPGTLYHVRAYATNSVGTAYGSDISFTALAILPTVTTTAISAIATTTATSGGNVTSDGGATVTTRGVAWSTTVNPTTSDNVTSNGSGTSTFTSNITGLTTGVTYHVRAYATNSVGTSYGADVSFTTLAVPTITTANISAITQTTATSGGNVTNSGGSSVTVRGVCWNTSPSPTTANSTTSDGTGTGAFTSAITGLTAATVYYVRAYAINSTGTAYGNQVSFTTAAVPPSGVMQLPIRLILPDGSSIIVKDFQ